MIKLVLPIWMAIYCAMFIDKNELIANPNLLDGVTLTIGKDQRSHQIFGELPQLGSGGCKTAFGLQDGYALVIPNGLSKGSAAGWERIVDEEVALDEFYSKYVKTSGVEKAKFTIGGTTNYALYSKNFNTYHKEGAFIIDMKNFNLPTDGHFSAQMPEQTVSEWMKMLMPIVEQYSELIRNGIVLPAGDELSYLYANQGSRHCSEQGPCVSIFAFDFSWKTETTSTNDKVQRPKAFSVHKPKIARELGYLLPVLLDVANNGYKTPTDKVKTFVKDVIQNCMNNIKTKVEDDKKYMLNADDTPEETIEEMFNRKFQKKLQEKKAEPDKEARKQLAITKRPKNEYDDLRRVFVLKGSCVKSLLKARPFLHAEFHAESRFETVQSGQKFLASCQSGYEATDIADVMYRCSGGIWIPDSIEMNEIKCVAIGGEKKLSHARVHPLRSAQNPFNNGASYMVSLTVWFFIAALN